MGLTLPYGQNHYMGEYATEGAALTWIQGNKWDTDGDGTGNPKAGMAFFDTAATKIKVHDGSAWVALGSATPAGSTTQVQFNNAGAFGADSVFVWDSGNKRLGVGCTDPAAHLEVASDSSVQIMARSFNDGPSVNPGLYVLRGRGTRASKTAVQSGDYLGALYFMGQYDSSTVGHSGTIMSVASANWSGSDQSAYLAFWTTNVTTWAERMRITSDGKVGIGTTAPAVPLDIVQSSSLWEMLQVRQYSTTAYPCAVLVRGRGTAASPAVVQSGDTLGGFLLGGQYNTGTSNYERSCGMYGTASETHSATARGTYLSFWTTPNTTTAIAERLRIASDGKVGIANTSPSALLTLGTAGTTAGTLSLAGGTSGVVTVQTAAAAGTWSLTLPTTGGTNGYFLQTNGSGVTTWAASSATPAGSNQQIQFNNSGSFGASNHLIWDGTRFSVIGEGTQLPSISGYAYGDNTATTIGAFRANGTLATPTAVLNGYNLGVFSFHGYNGSGFGIGAAIQASAEQNWTGSVYDSRMTFYTAKGTAQVEQMRLTSDGRLGIKNTSPSALISLGTAGTTAGTLSLAGSSSGTCTVQVAAAAGTTTFQLPATNGTSGHFLQTNGSGVTTWAAVTASAAGSTGYVQYNNGGALAAESGFAWDTTLKQVLIANNDVNTGVRITAASTTDKFAVVNFIRYRNSIASPTAVQNEDTIGYLGFSGRGATNIFTGAQIAVYAAGNYSDTSSPAYVVIRTAPSGSTTTVERFRITSDGHVYVGLTTAPTSGGSASLRKFIVSGDSTSVTGMGLETGGDASRVECYRANNTLASKTIVVSGDLLGAFNAYGWDAGTTPSYIAAGQLRIECDGTVAEDNVPGRMTYYTRNTSGTLAERMRLTSAGLVGIANTSPGALLTLGTAGTTAGTLSLAGGTSGVVTVQTAATAGTWSMTLPTSGGTNGYFLQTNGSGVTTWAAASGSVAGSNTQVQYNNSGVFGASSGFTFDSTNRVIDLAGDAVNPGLRVTAAGTSAFPFLTLRRYRNTVASPQAVQSGDVLGQIAFVGYGTTGAYTGAQFVGYADGTWTDSSSPAYLLFRTTPSGTTTPVERMRITSAGLLKVGVTTDALSGADVTVAKDTNASIYAMACSTAAASSYVGTMRARGTNASPSAVADTDQLARYLMYGYANGTWQACAEMRATVTGTVSGAIVPTALSFFTQNASGTFGERMRLTSDGKLGIANTSPSALLTLGTAGTTAGSLSLAGATSGTCTIQVAAVAGTVTFQLPASNGTDGYFLKTNGSGVTSWAAVSSGTTVDAGTAQGQVLFWNATGSAWTYAETSEWVWDDTNKRVGINVAAPSSRLDVGGDVEISSDAWHYYGDPTTDGSWRTGRVSADLVVQKRESGTWTTKHTFV